MQTQVFANLRTRPNDMPKCRLGLARVGAETGITIVHGMDLLSVMAHELGHIILGMDESSATNDVMTEALPVGVRRMPTPYDLGLEPSAAWAGSHTGLGLKESAGSLDAFAFLGTPPLFMTRPIDWDPLLWRREITTQPLSEPVSLPNAAARTAVDHLFSARSKAAEPAMAQGALASEEWEILAPDLVGGR